MSDKKRISYRQFFGQVREVATGRIWEDSSRTSTKARAKSNICHRFCVQNFGEDLGYEGLESRGFVVEMNTDELSRVVVPTKPRKLELAVIGASAPLLFDLW